MSEQAVIETIEEGVNDVVEAVVPEAYSVIRAIKSNKGLVAGAVVLGVAAGAAVGWIVANKYLQTRYEAILAEEIEKSKNFYAATHKEAFPEPKTDSEFVDAAPPAEVRGAFINYGGMHTGAETDEDGAILLTKQTETVVETHNIFLNGSALDPEQWDQDVENSKRTENFPYIISVDEFMANENDYEQKQLTYWAGDNTLVDDLDGTIIPDDSIVGEGTLSRFGHGSKDQKVVYVRNSRRELEFEIALSMGKYAVEVAGFDPEDDEDEDTMSGRSRIRAGRGDDD